ncbi:hypothetical protein J1N35_035132 [Gossypium stocksii]|uniref:Uncharacterized protein n=1 Tax=Gossypium stocksii TaxID=47602 RepID=A0A9D3ZR69_9ROSI|nr:hypothetical protein J1N35_035132 [Gossypium stocksii]
MRFNKRVLLKDQLDYGGSPQTPKNPSYGGCSYNISILCLRLEIHLKVLAIIEDGDERFNNEEQSHHDNNDFSDPDLDDIPKNIDDEGAVKGENVHPYSAENTRFGIVIRNNLGAFMTDVNPDATLAREFPKYPNIFLAYLLDKKSDIEVLFIRQQFDNNKDYLYAIKQYSLNLSVDYKLTKSTQFLYVKECWKASSGCN